MTLLSDNGRKELAERLQELEDEVTIVVFTQEQGLLGMPGAECDLCRETRELAGEFAAVTDRIRVEVHDFLAAGDTAAADYGIERIPALVLLGPDRRDLGIRFYGIPAGYELATIIGDLLRLSAGTPDLSAATRAALAGLGGDVHLKVFVTPACPYCPRVVYLAHQLAMASRRIRADAIEASEFPELVRRYGVMGVPKVVVNERVEVQGAVPEQVLVGMALGAVASPAAGAAW
jgi:glutaredoxin-like protein